MRLVHRGKQSGWLSEGRSAVPLVDLLGVKLATMTEEECVDHILDELGDGRGGWVLTVNLDILRKLDRDPGFGQVVSTTTLRVADGMPLVWASWLQGTPVSERVAGSNLIRSLSQRAADHGRSIFLLGGDEGTAEAAAAVLMREIPNLMVAGTYCPPVGFESDTVESQRVQDAVVAATPDIVYVALGCPKQEELIRNLKPKLPAAWWLGVGISFSFLSGDVRRAPKWMQRMGLEWVHRLVQEPGRLIRRYLIDDIPFAVRLFGRTLWGRLRWAGRS